MSDLDGHEKRDGDLAAVSALDDPVRERLYEAVCRRDEPIGRDDAAAEAGIGRALAAYHLDKLVDAGLLVASYRRPPGRGGPGAGRPAKVYARSDREFTVSLPHREYQLAAHLLADAVARDPGPGRAALDGAAREYGTRIGREHMHADADRPPAEDPLVATLRRQGYEPAVDEDGTVRMRNCPFHELARQHTDVVCTMNLALIEGLVDGLGTSRELPVLDPQPGYCCVAIHRPPHAP